MCVLVLALNQRQGGACASFEDSHAATEPLRPTRGLAVSMLQAMRSSWRQREINTTDPLLASSSTAPAADQHETERQQIEAAIRNSIADMTEQSKAPAVTTTPAASRRLLTESFPPDSAHLTDSGTAHGEGTMEYWDEVLDGPSGSAVSRGACNGFGGSDRFRHVSGGGTGGGMDPNVEYSNGDGWGARGSGGFCADEDGGLKKNEKDWNPVLAVALSVVELDATVEIPSEAAREGFSHTLLTLLKSVLEVDERRMRVRDSNEVFRENVGRCVRLDGARVRSEVGIFVGAPCVGLLKSSGVYDWCVFCVLILSSHRSAALV